MSRGNTRRRASSVYATAQIVDEPDFGHDMHVLGVAAEEAMQLRPGNDYAHAGFRKERARPMA
jgi:hypothetical protein